MKYLCAVDGSTAAKKAFDASLRMLRRDQDELYLVSVQDSSALEELFSNLDAKSKRRHELEKLVDEYVKTAKEQGFRNVTSRVLVGGSARDVITDEAEKERCDVVVIGARGHTKLSRMLIGSVSDYVVKHAPCSVMVVK